MVVLLREGVAAWIEAVSAPDASIHFPLHTAHPTVNQPPSELVKLLAGIVVFQLHQEVLT